MKISIKRLALLLAVPISLFAATELLRAAPSNSETHVTIRQGSDLAARVDAVEKRIATLKQTVKSNPKFKQHQGSLATLENRKNTIKFKMKGDDAAAKAQLENDLKLLEDKVAELEKSIK